MAPHDHAGRQPGGESSRLLDAIRGSDEAAKREALERLYDLLHRHAAAFVGRHRGGADLQPESVVQSVLAEALERGRLANCDDDAHLAARLKIAVKHKILDRKKKRKPVPFEDACVDFTTGGQGPGTAAMALEEAEADEARFSNFRRACIDALPSAAEQRLLQGYLFDQESWEEIAEAMNTTPGAAKKKMTAAIRPRVLQQLLDPLRRCVDGRLWAIIDLHFMQRRPVTDVATHLDMRQQAVERSLRDEILPVLIDHFGSSALPYFQRLLGRVRG